MCHSERLVTMGTTPHSDAYGWGNSSGPTTVARCQLCPITSI